MKPFVDYTELILFATSPEVRGPFGYAAIVGELPNRCLVFAEVSFYPYCEITTVKRCRLTTEFSPPPKSPRLPE